MWWDELESMDRDLSSLISNLDDTAVISPLAKLQGEVHVGEGSHVCEGASIEGPVWIGRNCVVGKDAQLRGPLRIEDGTRIGSSCEIVRSLIGPGVSIGPQCFIGDSRIDRRAYLGALVRTSNRLPDGGPVSIQSDDGFIDSGQDKLGAWIGAWSALGVGVITLPGRVIAPGTQFGPRVTVDRNLPPGRYSMMRHLHSQAIG